MSKITDYSFLFQSMFGGTRINTIKLSGIGSSSVQAQLRAAGIDTSSKQYKAALKEMMKNGNGAMYTNVQAIKNLMSQYDKNGDWIDPNTGLTGLAVTDENRDTYKHIISIPESSRQEMFDLVKTEFLKENGIQNGDTTKREDVYINLYKKMNKEDRLSAGWTMEQYEHQYRQAFAAAAKAADPTWKAGDPIPAGALDNVTRESVENAGKSVNIKNMAVTGVGGDHSDVLRGMKKAEDTKEDDTSMSGSVAFNAGKRARQLAAAKTPAQVQVVLSLLSKDLTDCEAGLTKGMCDDNEVAKVKAMIQRAEQRMSEVSAAQNSEQGEGIDGFMINMLM